MAVFPQAGVEAAMTQKINQKQTLGQCGKAIAAISVIAISACGSNQAGTGLGLEC
jgi:hypothetical protein